MVTMKIWSRGLQCIAFQRNTSAPNKKKKTILFSASAHLLPVFIFDPEDGGERFLLNIVLSLNYITLQPR